MTEFNYCPKCGEELVEDAKFCHSCGQDLADLSKSDNSSKEESESDEDDPYEDFRYIDETTMEDIDVHDLRHSDGEYYEILENAVEEQIEENDITIDEIDAEQLLTHIFVEKVIERSTRIKIEKAKEQ